MNSWPASLGVEAERKEARLKRGRANKGTYSSPYKLLPSPKLSLFIGSEKSKTRRNNRQQSANHASVILNRLEFKRAAFEELEFQLAATDGQQELPNQCQPWKGFFSQLTRRRRRKRCDRTQPEEVTRVGCEYISMISGHIRRPPAVTASSRGLLGHNKVKKKTNKTGKSEIGGCRIRSVSAGNERLGYAWLGLLLLICFSCLLTPTIAELSSNNSNLKPHTNSIVDDIAQDENDVLLQTSNGIFRGYLLQASEDKFQAADNRLYGGDSHEGEFLDLNEKDNLRRKTSLPVSEVVAFLGIRYASAPIKRLRFMPPTAYHYGQSQVHDVRNFGPICPQQWPVTGLRFKQANSASGQQERRQLVNLMARVLSRESQAHLRPLMSQLVNFEQSEDCLNLNIYTQLKAISTKVINRKYPNTDNKNALLPVLVIIHGESFDYGSGNTINGSRFVERNEIIVVTFNYRLNILGFPPRLPGASRGNLGLMDQVAALHWIKDNIESFGGSASNITLMGSKRAAIFVNLLMMSPLAKDLFQRAIMEDGSALTPLVANHIHQQQTQPLHFPSGSLNTHKVPSSQAIQHIRLLAKLCDCPLRFSAPVPQTQTTLLAATGRIQQSSANNTGPQVTSGADETRTNALMFDCLRDRPVEQMIQFQPMGLIHFNQLTGELALPSKLWAKYLRLLDAQQEGQTQRQPSPSAELVTLEPREVNGFLARVTSMLMALNESSWPANELLLELFDSIHLAKRKSFSATGSLHPIYAPIIDGTIVPDEDLALSMLKGPSSFSHRHLLIGLSTPLLVHNNQSEFWKEADNHGFQLSRDHPLADWISLPVERDGLTNEEAVELINLFVRSFYRFHNQEITNSIISQYLNSIVIGKAQQRRRQNLNYTRRPQEEDDLDGNKAREQQLLVLGSLLEAFKDALVNVPVLKTALIHATKQLEPLVEPFIGQQFERWKRDGHKSTQPANNNQLLESFITFAQTLYTDKNWPLELQAPQGQTAVTLNNPKATYLYQFDAYSILKQIRLVLAKLDVTVAKNLDANTNLWLAMKVKTSDLLNKLQGGLYLDRMGIGCALDANLEQQEDFLLNQLLLWLCDKFGSTLANFAMSGNVNKHLQKHDTDESILRDEIQQFTENRNCIRQVVSIATRESPLDHHSVNPTSLTYEPAIMIDSNCSKQLELLTLKFLKMELSGDLLDSEESWRVFDVFNQLVATIPGNLTQGQRWKSNELIYNDDFEHGSLLTRASFWSNFIPALNCSKTQPINPLSLLGGNHFSTSATSSAMPTSSLNSTLMNINLVFSCQSGLAIRTVHEIIDSMVVNIGNDLQLKIDRWLSLNNRSQSMQNHHSLRMANLNQSNSMMFELENLENQQSGKQDSYINSTIDSNNSLLLIGHEQAGKTNFNSKINFLSADGITKYGTIVLCGLLVIITIAGLLYERRKRKLKQPDPGCVNAKGGEHVIGLKAQNRPPGEEVSNQPVEFKQLFVNDGEHNHQNLMPNGVIPHLNGLEEAGSNNDRQAVASHVYAIGTYQDAKVHQQQLQQQQPIGTYWTTITGNPEDTITLCRSHSTLSMSNGSTIVENIQKLAGQKIDGNDQDQMHRNNCNELIMSMMMPPEAPTLRNPHDTRFESCLLLSNGSSLSGNGHYGGSSGETQNQSSLSSQTTTSNNLIGSGTMKKRVKIRDPPTREASLDRNRQARASKQIYSNSSRQQLFCPVHHQLNRQEEEQGESPEANFLATNLNPNDYYVGQVSYEYPQNFDPSLQWAETQLIEGQHGQQILIPSESVGQLPMSNNVRHLTNQQMIYHDRHPDQE